MVTDMEKVYGEQMDAAIVEGAKRLDIASDTWAERVDMDKMFMEAVDMCLLTQVFGGYKVGLDFLGIDLGEEYGFDIPDTIYDIDAQFEAYEMLAQKWEAVIGHRTES